MQKLWHNWHKPIGCSRPTCRILKCHSSRLAFHPSGHVLEVSTKDQGCTPRPGAFTRLGDQMIKIWKASVDRPDGLQGEPGQIIRVDDQGIAVAASEGSVLLTDLQPESRKRTPAADFARGAHLKPGDRFEVRFELART